MANYTSTHSGAEIDAAVDKASKAIITDSQSLTDAQKSQARTNMNAAAADHTHSEYASSSHTHSEYAAAGHTHTEYAAVDHTHSEYEASNTVVTATGTTPMITLEVDQSSLVNGKHLSFSAPCASTGVTGLKMGTGGNWTSSTLPSEAMWISATYGNGKFVAIAYESDVAVYSTDGINWTITTLPSSAGWCSVIYGDGKFVAISGMEGASNTAAYSTDGITWSSSTLPSSAGWYSVTYGDGKFVAIAHGSNTAAYSTDGITWSSSTLPSEFSTLGCSSVTYGDGKFVAMGYISQYGAYSTDGINWTTFTLPDGLYGSQSITHGNGKFVALGLEPGTAAYSTDGINWTITTLPSNVNWFSITYGDGKFVAVGIESDTAAYSTDGITWSSSTLPSSGMWSSVTYGNGKFVAVSVQSTTAAYVSVASIPPIYQIINANGNDYVSSGGEWVSGAYVTIMLDCTNSKAYVVNEHEQPAGGYLVFSSPSSFTLAIDRHAGWDGILEYSTDAIKWNEWSGSTTLTAVAISNTYYLYLRGTNNTAISDGSSSSFVLSGSSISCDGNIENLLDYKKVAKGIHPSMASECYRFMFYNCTSLVKAPELPATTLAYQCYDSMFRGCTSLIKAPELPATTLAGRCYDSMFMGCTSLTEASELPATTLAGTCYANMFDACSSLVKAPELSATTLADYCYMRMFYNCTSLVKAPELPATTLTTYCYAEMFKGCTSLIINTASASGYSNQWKIPATSTSVSNWNKDMFSGTGGTQTSDPALNTVYYVKDYSVPGFKTAGIVKNDGNGNLSAAVAGTDYAAADHTHSGYVPTSRTIAGIDLSDDITKKELNVAINNAITITNSDVTVELDDTKGVSPYSTSYGYTNITINTLTTSDLVEGTRLLMICSDSLVVVSANRNARIRFGSTGSWIPVFHNASIASGHSYLGSGHCRLLSYSTKIYNSGAFQVLTDNNTSYSAAGFGIGYATCSTAEATTAKTASMSSYSLATNGIVAVKFTYGVPANATLNINSKGAKSIYYKAAAITADVIKAGDIATFIYDGSRYRLLAIDRKVDESYTETDPVFTASAAYGITSSDISNWNSKLNASQKGSVNGVAELDANGKVPSAQLPSYVDDVLEYASTSAFPATGETGKIYVAMDTNKTYRWSGSAYVEISPSLALGETSSTAYRGDRGKTAYDHSQNGDIHVTAAQKSTWNGKQDAISDIATIRSGAALGATALQTETDPTVPSWAKAANKPSYNASEITAGTFPGQVVANNNTNYTTKQVRNIILSTGDPSGGSNGDIWIKYNA